MFKVYEFIKKCYENSKIPNKMISFFNLEKQLLKYILYNENNNCSYNTTKAHMIQCKYMISFNKLFNLRTIFFFILSNSKYPSDFYLYKQFSSIITVKTHLDLL